ncbi:hypothetical protein FA13DRAFT_1797281 [Coprinellus micaceus]|uniref:NACHT domain-containing protein n=1 Tax=Coprinellus micaceus TaxID=71717 RepID=A0A4Y7SRS5_COPMI|nr:hypothetical protein FA13DRAFT_1797281 [Coprinellus micaceus]
MPLGGLIRCLLCRGNEAVSPVDESSAGISSGAEVVPLGRLQSNPAVRPFLSPASITLLPSLDGKQFEASVEYQRDHPPTRVSRSPEETASSPPTSSHFHGQIEEANINHVGGHYFDNRIAYTLSSPGPARDLGIDGESRRLLDELGKKSALGAVVNAEERAYAPRCLHETRTRVLNNLGEWSAAEGRWKDAKLLVLTGPAGHGKTAIMQSFAEQLLRRSRGTNIVIATFFFKATIPDQNQPKALVTTLAYQVAEHWPSFQDNIVSVIRDNVRILSTSLEHQMDHLLTGPIVRSHASPPSPPFVVICAVDGLDECDGDDAQSRVIRLLHTLSTIPNTRVVLASRPEFPIQSVLKSGMSGMLHIDLNKDYNAAGDIRQFTWVRLLEIRDKLLPSINRVSWPRERDAEQIADHSSGQFILAETAMKYVDDRRYDPRKRLEEVH